MADETSTPKNPRGRPRAAAPLSSVGTRLPQPYHDRLIQMANMQEKSVSALVRDLLTTNLR